jgi:methyl-accepting chemotaxis protein
MTAFAVNAIMAAASKIFAQQGVIIAEKAAAVIDGDAFERLAETLDAEDPFYESTRLDLLRIKNDTSSAYLYTMTHVQGSTYRYIIDGSAPPEDTENFSALGDEEDTAGYDSAFKKCWKEKSTGFSGLHYEDGWGWMVSVYTPILNSRGVMVGIVGCDFDGTDVHEEIRNRTMQQIILGLCFTAAGLAIMFFFLKLIFSRLKTINSLLKEISDGEGDLTRRIKILHQDEIGELGKYFNKTLEKIKNLVVAIKDRTSSLFSIGNELAENMIQTAEAIREIGASIQNIKAQVKNQSASVTETNAAMEQVTLNIDRLNTNVEMQTASVSQSSSAVEEMLANIQSVTQTLIRNAENVRELTSASEVGRTGLEQVSRDIKEIAKESEGLLEINAVMENIASQTNLLSMNAAIEAAHAGDAGKGFAVVAGEIRKLAENSSKQSNTISVVLKKIKDSIDKITNSTNTVLGKFQAIDGRIKIVSDQEENIRNAMKEQGQGSQQILGAIGKLNELTQQVKDGSGRMLEGSKEVIGESENLDTVTQKLSGGVNDVVQSADQIISAVSRVNEVSRINKEHIDALVSEVAKFKVE